MGDDKPANSNQDIDNAALQIQPIVNIKRGHLNIDQGVRAALSEAHAEKLALIRAAKGKPALTEAKALGNYKIAQIKLFVSENKQKFEEDIKKLVDYEATEKAKAELKKDENMKRLAKDDYKKLAWELRKFKKVFESDVKGEVARTKTRQFMHEMQDFVVEKTAVFKENAYGRQAVALDEKIQAVIAAARKKPASNATDSSNAKPATKSPK